MDLLEKLALSARCEYLSDLRTLDPHHLCDLLLGFSADNYPLRQWLDAEDYLCRLPTGKVVFNMENTRAGASSISCEDVRQRMVDELGRDRRERADG